MLLILIAIGALGIREIAGASLDCQANNPEATAYCNDYCISLHPGRHGASHCALSEVWCMCEVDHNRFIRVRVLQDLKPAPYVEPTTTTAATVPAEVPDETAEVTITIGGGDPHSEGISYIPAGQAHRLMCDGGDEAESICNTFCVDVIHASFGACNVPEQTCSCTKVQSEISQVGTTVPPIKLNSQASLPINSVSMKAPAPLPAVTVPESANLPIVPLSMEQIATVESGPVKPLQLNAASAPSLVPPQMTFPSHQVPFQQPLGQFQQLNKPPPVQGLMPLQQQLMFPQNQMVLPPGMNLRSPMLQSHQPVPQPKLPSFYSFLPSFLTGGRSEDIDLPHQGFIPSEFGSSHPSQPREVQFPAAEGPSEDDPIITVAQSVSKPDELGISSNSFAISPRAGNVSLTTDEQ